MNDDVSEDVLSFTEGLATYGAAVRFFPVWILMCIFIVLFFSNVTPHSGQSGGQPIFVLYIEQIREIFRILSLKDIGATS